ncbi:MAG: hypothetical protein ABFC73_05360 [Clostridiaceae bacterium]
MAPLGAGSAGGYGACAPNLPEFDLYAIRLTFSLKNLGLDKAPAGIGGGFVYLLLYIVASDDGSIMLDEVVFMALDYRQIANGGKAFFEIGYKFINTEGHPIGPVLIPYYVNIAFACELFMKAIIVYHRKDISVGQLRGLGHNLEKLYSSLPESIRQEIEYNIPDAEVKKRTDGLLKVYKHELSNNPPDDERLILESRIRNSPATFIEMLVIHSSTFENWRYYYEAGANTPIFCDEWFLSVFSSSLHSILAAIMRI